MEISEIKINGLYRFRDNYIVRVWDITPDGNIITQIGAAEASEFSAALPVGTILTVRTNVDGERYTFKITEEIPAVFYDTVISGIHEGTGEILEFVSKDVKIVKVKYPELDEDYDGEKTLFQEDMEQYLAQCSIPYSSAAIHKICDTAIKAKKGLRDILSHSEFYNPDTMCIDTIADIPNPSSERDASYTFNGILNSYREEYPNDYKRLVRVYKFFDINKFLNIEDNSEFKELGLHIANGMKPSRAINKFFQETGISRVSNYEKEFAKLSDYLTNNSIKRRITLSVNPIDYLRMAEGVSWTSCHNIRRKGCFCNGVFSYMMDKQAMVLSLLDPNNEEPTYLQNKINRMMFFLNDNNDILQSRLYPQVRIPAIEDFLANWVNDIISKCLDVENRYQKAVENTTCAKYVDSQGVHYRDYGCDGFGQRIFTQNGETPKQFYIGHESYCVNCGQVNTNTGRIVDNCGDSVYASKYLNYRCPITECMFDDTYIADGTAKLNPADGKYYLEWHECKDCGAIFFGRHIYCENCRDHHDIPICEECGEIIVGDVIEVDGKTYCQSCFDEYFEVCKDCGKIIARDDAYELSGSSGDFICEECYENSANYFRCEDCGDICYRDDAIYIEGYGDVCEYCYNHGEFGYCADCGSYYHRDDLRYVEAISEDICDNCFDENYGYCERCDEPYPTDDLTEVEGGHYCQWCIDHYATTCEHCGGLTFDPTEVDDTMLCGECVENETEQCESCHVLHLRDNMTEIDGEWLCEDCIPEEEEETTESTPTQTSIVFDDGYMGILTSDLDTFGAGTAIKVLHYDPATEQYTIQIDYDGREYYRTVERTKIA